MGKEETAQMLRYFGSQVKHFRGLKGMTQEELGKAVGYSLDTIASIEQGRRPPPLKFFDPADCVLCAGGIIANAKRFLEFPRYPAFFAEFADAEAKAISVSYYECMAIPGPLQTEPYARAAISAYCPPYSPEQVDQYVAARLERKALLTRKPPAILGFVIEHAVLRRPIGGREAFKKQLLHVAEAARRNNVTLQVMPDGCEEHAGLEGPMTLLETEDRRMVGYVEYQGGSEWVSKPEDVSVLHQRYGIIRAQALTTRDSLALIESLAGEL
ncbi:helix-turn-helix transcriptional regulator [Streptomyces sp. ICBB 8177]|uniref:helix-turn-helix domain-containing protein n=1 Tax=Streptomyces sp. ICBB 8177 TaxID=563922 RepID=UPI0013054574|nr:helix-turn-helix transcriptional regulator [Streptomyces sp. ICBB 8177]